MMNRIFHDGLGSILAGIKYASVDMQLRNPIFYNPRTNIQACDLNEDIKNPLSTLSYTCRKDMSWSYISEHQNMSRSTVILLMWRGF